MSKLKLIYNTLSGILFSILSYLLGGLDTPIIILLIVIILDYLTGICKGILSP